MFHLVQFIDAGTAYLLRKWPNVFENCDKVLQTFVENLQWLNPFRFILQSKYIMNDFDLKKLINLEKEVNESCPSKQIVDKLISDQGIKSFLVVKKTEPLTKHLLEFCHCHPSLDDFRSLPWEVISDEIQSGAAANSSSSRINEEKLLKLLWNWGWGHEYQVTTVCIF